MESASSWWQLLGTVLVGAGVALQFANLYADRAGALTGLPWVRTLLRSRLVQLGGGFALVAFGIMAITHGAGR